MIKNTIFVCLENYTYGMRGELDNCIFIKGKLYNVVIDDIFDSCRIKITDDNGHWIRFHKSGNFNDTILNNFIELKEYRKEKLRKIQTYGRI